MGWDELRTDGGGVGGLGARCAGRSRLLPINAGAAVPLSFAGVTVTRVMATLAMTLVTAAWVAGMLAAGTGGAHAAPNLVLNGNFTSDSLTPGGSGYSSFELGSYQVNGSGPTYTGSVADWAESNSGAYIYEFTSGTATAIGSYGTLALNSGSSIGTAPSGGNFIGADGDFGSYALTQNITGLEVGAPVTVSFWWGAAQQTGAQGSTTQYWQVSLGGSTQDTTTYDLAQGAFSGWMQVTMTFIPTSTSEVLSFLGVGTGSPPFLLLSGVSVTNPEPASWAILLSGLVALGTVSRLRRRSAQRRAATV